jgi:hypothetical protein
MLHIYKALILAKTLEKFRHIHEATRGIIFLGTPHRGSAISWPAIGIAIMTMPFFGSDTALLRFLVLNSTDLVNKSKLNSGKTMAISINNVSMKRC